MKKGYVFSFWYNNRWTNNGILENGIIYNYLESIKKDIEFGFKANARRDIRIIEFEYYSGRQGEKMNNIKIIEELSYIPA